MGSAISSLVNDVSSAVSSIVNNPIVDAVAEAVCPEAGIAISAFNALSGVLGGSIGQFAQNACQSFGMPSFIANDVMGAIGQLFGQNQQPSNPGLDQLVQGQFGKDLAQLGTDITKLLNDALGELLGQNGTPGNTGTGSTGGTGGTGSTSGASGTGSTDGGDADNSWLAVLAKAMGNAAGKVAARMVDLSNKIQTEVGQQSQGSSSDQAAAAQQTTADQSELQAQGQQFSMLMNAASNVIKSLGDGLSTMARHG